MATIDLLLGNGVASAVGVNKVVGATDKKKSVGDGAESSVPGVKAEVGEPGKVEVANEWREADERKPMSYVQMYEAMNPDKPESAEDAERRMKREKREGTIAAIGDGISALANLWFASKGAPSMYNADNSMSGAVKERWDKLKAERERIKDKYNAGLYEAWMRDRDESWRREQWDYAKERDKRSEAREDAREKRAEDKAQRQAALDDAKLALTYGKLTYQGYQNYIAEVKAGKIAELTDAQIAHLNRMGTGKSGGGGKPAEHPWYDKDGNLHYAHSASAAEGNSRVNGTWVSDNETETKTAETQKRGRVTQSTTTQTQKPRGGHSAKPAQKGAKTKDALRGLGLK